MGYNWAKKQWKNLNYQISVNSRQRSSLTCLAVHVRMVASVVAAPAIAMVLDKMLQDKQQQMERKKA